MHKSKNKRYGETKDHIIETHSNDVVMNGSHIKKTSTDTIMETMFNFPYDIHNITHWKYVLRCCSKCTRLYIPVEY